MVMIEHIRPGHPGSNSQELDHDEEGVWFVHWHLQIVERAAHGKMSPSSAPVPRLLLDDRRRWSYYPTETPYRSRG